MWEIAITLSAIGLLAAFHLVRAPTDGATDGGRPGRLGGRDDPWTRFLVAAGLGAALFAVGVLIVPAITDSGSGSAQSTTSTSSTTTEPTSTTTTTTSTSTTTSSTTTTTTAPPTTTTPTHPPRGAAVFVRVSVNGATGRVATVLNRLGGRIIVRQVSRGVYNLQVPALSAGARSRTVVRVQAGPNTTAVGSWGSGSTLVVLTWDKAKGVPASRNFMVVVWGARRDLTPLPKTR